MTTEAIEKRLLLRRAKRALELGGTPMTQEYYDRLVQRHADAAPDDFDSAEENIVQSSEMNRETLDRQAAEIQRERTSFIQRGLFDDVENL